MPAPTGRQRRSIEHPPYGVRVPEKSNHGTGGFLAIIHKKTAGSLRFFLSLVRIQGVTHQTLVQEADQMPGSVLDRLIGFGGHF